MSLKPISATTLHELDHGVVGEIIDSALQAMVLDLDDRGDDGKEREVEIKIKGKIKEGYQDFVVTAKAKLPAYRSRPTRTEPGRKDGQTQAYFQSMNPERPDQPTLPGIDEEKAQ